MNQEKNEITTTINHMGGISFKLNPIQTLKIVMTSMIIGEPQYYKNNNTKQQKQKKDSKIDFNKYMILQDPCINYVSLFNDALEYDFAGCIDLISILRDQYMMRLNPQILVVQALLHEKRAEFNKANPGVMKKAIIDACVLPTDLCKQLELIKLSSKPIPNVWKRAAASRLENMSRYQALKYINGSKSGTSPKNPNVKYQSNLVDLIRLTHPVGKEGSVVEELVKTGKLTSTELCEDTWERLRSAGNSWQYILTVIKLPHMALLRNLRNILLEYSSLDDDKTYEITQLCNQLIKGVEKGRQYPFRYFSAYKTLKDGDIITVFKKPIKFKSEDKINVTINHKYLKLFHNALEECLKVSLSTIPELEGRVDCLTDNSDSAHGAFTSEYGSVKVSEISNLSAILSAMRALNGGSVWIFGDDLVEFVVDKNGSILEQLEHVNKIGMNVGGSTESGIWLFWKKMIKEKKHLDNVFIYSDQQAGYAGLYVSSKHLNDAKEYVINKMYVDVLKMINDYREQVYPKLNVFTVQVAGYSNTLIPAIIYRGAVLSGWTGKEIKMAYEMVKVWNDIEK